MPLNNLNIVSFINSLSEDELKEFLLNLKDNTNLNISKYDSPIPVVAGLIPLTNGNLLGMRRGTEPLIGGLSFPGGYIEKLEDPAFSVSREIHEETGLLLEPNKFNVFGNPLVNPNNILLTFFIYNEPISHEIIHQLEPTIEALSFHEITKHTPLCFPLHETKRKVFFNL